MYKNFVCACHYTMLEMVGGADVKLALGIDPVFWLNTNF